MANDLERIASLEASIETYVKRVPEWETVVLPILKTRNEINSVEMGGEHPRAILIALGVLDPTPSTPTVVIFLNLNSINLGLKRSCTKQKWRISKRLVNF